MPFRGLVLSSCVFCHRHHAQYEICYPENIYYQQISLCSVLLSTLVTSTKQASRNGKLYFCSISFSSVLVLLTVIRFSVRYIFFKKLNQNRFPNPAFFCLFQLKLHAHSQFLLPGVLFWQVTQLSLSVAVYVFMKILITYRFSYAMTFFSIVTIPATPSKGKFSFNPASFTCMLR